MSKEVYRRLSKAERKLESTNRLRTNNTTLRIKYEGIKKLLEKQNKEIERLNNIINELEKYIGIKMNSFGICNASDIYLKLQELKGSNGAIPPEVIGTNGEDGGLFEYGDR